MQFKVYPLRRRGRRISWREVRNSPPYSGDLITHIREVNRELIVVATLMNAEAPATSTLLPDLYQPVLAVYGADPENGVLPSAIPGRGRLTAPAWRGEAKAARAAAGAARRR